MKPDAPEFAPRIVGASTDDVNNTGDVRKEEQTSTTSETAKKEDKRVARVFGMLSFHLGDYNANLI